MKNIAIFASGSGSNAEQIIRYFQQTKTACVKFIITDNKQAGVINRAKKLGVPSFYFSKEDLANTESVIEFLQQNNIALIVLAGYLKKIPESLIDAFPNSIINIHPALLPDFGGKGMYGIHVHEAVLKAQRKQSGISIHYVNNNFDEGEIVFQATCDVEKSDTPQLLAAKVLELEHAHYATIIDKVLKSTN